jgi:predicted porin
LNRKYRISARLITSCLAACAAGAQAQSSVTLYGIADAGLRYSNGLDAAYAGSAGSSTMLNSGVDSTSRLGYRGVEDLGGGLKAVFNLESGLNFDSGTTSNASKFFDRASTVGLGTGWGTVTLGRQTTVLADALNPIDPLGVRFASLNPNVGVAALSSPKLGIEYGPSGSSSGSYRLDNSIKYTGKFNDFSVRAMHALGEQSGNASKLSSTGFGLAYETAALSASLAYAHLKTATELSLKGYVGGVSAKAGVAKLSLSYGSHTADTSATAKTTNKTLGLGATVPLSPTLDLIVAHYQVNRSRTGNVDDGYKRSIAFLEYKLSKRTLVYLEADSTGWKNNYAGSSSKGTGSGLSAGMKHSF